MEYISFILLLIGIILASFLWKFKKDANSEKEAYRCLNNFCEHDENSNSEEVVHTNGVEFFKNTKTNKTSIIKQSKPIDIGVLG